MPCPIPQSVSLSPSHFATLPLGCIGTETAPANRYVNSLMISASAKPFSMSPCSSAQVAFGYFFGAFAGRSRFPLPARRSGALGAMASLSVDVLDPRVRMRARQKRRIQHVREPHPARILSLAGESGNGDFGQRRHGLTDDVEIFRWVALPLLRLGFLWKLDHLVAGQMSPAGGVIPHHRCHDVNDGIRLRFDCLFVSA